MTAKNTPAILPGASIKMGDWSFTHDEGLGAGRTSVTGPGLPIADKALHVYHDVKINDKNRLQACLVAEYPAGDEKSLSFMRDAFPESAGYKMQVTLNKLGRQGNSIRVAFPPIDLYVSAEQLKSPGVRKFALSMGMDEEEVADARPVDLFARRAIRAEPVRTLIAGAMERAANEQALSRLAKSLSAMSLSAIRAEVSKAPNAVQELLILSVSMIKENRSDLYMNKRASSDELLKNCAVNAKAFTASVAKKFTESAANRAARV